MAEVAGSPGEFALGALNAATPWLQLFGLAEDPGFNITGTFVGTITFQVSNQSSKVKTRVSEPASYTAIAGPLAIPRADGAWCRFIMSAYTSGTAYVGFTKPLGAGQEGVPGNIQGQVDSNVPGTDIF